jgi:hypothetical protein
VLPNAKKLIFEPSNFVMDSISRPLPHDQIVAFLEESFFSIASDVLQCATRDRNIDVAAPTAIVLGRDFRSDAIYLHSTRTIKLSIEMYS